MTSRPRATESWGSSVARRCTTPIGSGDSEDELIALISGNRIENSILCMTVERREEDVRM